MISAARKFQIIRLRGLTVLFSLCILALPGARASEPGQAAVGPGLAAEPKLAAGPKLVVVVAIDQLRKDRVSAALPGGLGRLLRAGRNFIDSDLDHGITNTCPGHAVMLTGVQPGRAGIAGNEFVDRNSWASRYCVEDDNSDYQVLGGQGNRSPRMLQVDALGDWLKASYPDARVFSVAGKDRAAIMLGGQRPDGAYWYNADNIGFTTSGYYAPTIPAYLQEFTGPASFRSGLPALWEHPAGSYRPDDFAGEATANLRVSGHPLNSGEVVAIGKQIYASPFIDTATLQLARVLVEQEQLGQDNTPDLLAISLSGNDNVGHLYGPFSAEAEDTLQNIDQQLAGFMDFLDARVGPNSYVMVLSSDHGVADLPEWRSLNGDSQCPAKGGRPALLPTLASLFWQVYWQQTGPFDMPGELVKFAGEQVYINPAYVTANNLNFAQFETQLQDMLRSVAVVRQVWSRADLAASTTEEARLLRHSLVPARSGDLILQLWPDCVVRSDGTGTTHGSLYDYDRAIPLVFYGAGVLPGQVGGAAHSVDIAPTLADLLGLAMPAGLDGRILPLGSAAAAEHIVETHHQ